MKIIPLTRSAIEKLRPAPMVSDKATLPTGRTYERIAFDKQSARRFDDNGFMHVDMCNISKAVVNPYLGEEIDKWSELGLEPKKVYQILRPAEELAKAAPTFNCLPLMDVHIPVSSFDLENPEIKKHQVGTTASDATFQDPYLKCSITVQTDGAIKQVESNALRELSCCYRYEIDMVPGDLNGVHYDGRMFDLRGNHVALVSEGRAGSEVMVRDEKTIKDEAPALNEVEQLTAIKARITDIMKPGLSEEQRKVLDDCTSAIDIAVHHLLDFMEDTPAMAASMVVTVDDNPDGINQYSGASHAKLAEHHYRLSKIAEAKGDHVQAQNHLEKAKGHERVSQIRKAAGVGDANELTVKDLPPYGGDTIVTEPGHKNSEGESAPVVIKSEKTGKSLWSGTSRAEAHNALGRMASFKDCSVVAYSKDIAKRKEVSPKSGVTEYGSVEFADPKNKKYPIDTPEHVRSAAGYFGQSKNRNKYSKEDQSQIDKRIDSAKKKFKIGEYAK